MQIAAHDHLSAKPHSCTLPTVTSLRLLRKPHCHMPRLFTRHMLSQSVTSLCLSICLSLSLESEPTLLLARGGKAL